MPRNKVAWRRLVVVVLIIASLALLTVSVRQADSGPVHAIQQAGRSVYAPLQTWGAKAAEPFQNGYRWLKTLWSAHKEVDRLQAELQELQGEAVKLREQADENERLKGYLDFREKLTFPEGVEFKMASVINKSPSRWQAWIEIDKGSADGVKVNQAVVGATPKASDSISGKGLVGKVVSVTAHTAQVLLITDASSSVSAKIQGSRAEGIVEGSVSGRLVMDYVDRDILVEPKLIVVTSGYGGVYPSAIPIGIVANVGEGDVSIFKEIEVQAFVDFRVLEEVMVIMLQGEDVIPRMPTTTVPSTIRSTTSTTLAPSSQSPHGPSAATTTSTTVPVSGLFPELPPFLPAPPQDR